MPCASSHQIEGISTIVFMHGIYGLCTGVLCCILLMPFFSGMSQYYCARIGKQLTHSSHPVLQENPRRQSSFIWDNIFDIKLCRTPIFTLLRSVKDLLESSPALQLQQMKSTCTITLSISDNSFLPPCFPATH